MPEAKKTLKLISYITTTAAQFSDEQIEKLLSGQASLAYKESKIKNTDPSSFDTELATLKQIDTRNDAIQYIETLNLKKVKLLKMAEAFKVNASAKDRKELIIQKIVESTVGHRLRSNALHSMDLDSNNTASNFKREVQ